MMMKFLLVAIVGLFFLSVNEAKPKPDTIEVIQNGANTEIVDFKPNGREEVIDINQTPWGSQTYVREYSWYPNYGYNYGGYNNYYGGYNNYNSGYNNYYNRGYGNYYGGWYGKK